MIGLYAPPIVLALWATTTAFGWSSTVLWVVALVLATALHAAAYHRSPRRDRS